MPHIATADTVGDSLDLAGGIAELAGKNRPTLDVTGKVLGNLGTKLDVYTKTVQLAECAASGNGRCAAIVTVAKALEFGESRIPYAGPVVAGAAELNPYYNNNDLATDIVDAPGAIGQTMRDWAYNSFCEATDGYGCWR